MTKIKTMTRSTRIIFLLALALALVPAATATPTAAQEPSPKPTKEIRLPEEPDKHAAKGWEDAGLGEHHQRLERMVGNWMAQVRIYPAPDAEPVVGRGIARSELMLGGRFVKTDYKGEVAGESFQGYGLDGYDEATGKHVGVWVDSMSSKITNFSGECEDDGQKITMHAEVVNPDTGEVRKKKSITSFLSTARYTYEEWDENDQGEMVRTMQVIFSRQ